MIFVVKHIELIYEWIILLTIPIILFLIFDLRDRHRGHKHFARNLMHEMSTLGEYEYE
jgi:hypothetical protein